MRLVLASASPRRKRLLRLICKRFSVRIARIEEKIRRGEPFGKAAERLALLKAKKVAKREKEAIVIGADTIAYRGKRVYRKTENEKAARKVLLELRGKTHYVITGVAVLFPGGKCKKWAVKAAVKMKNYGERGLASYLRSGEWKGRAGCYDISGRGRALVASIRGEKETVIGLPLKRLKKELFL